MIAKYMPLTLWLFLEIILRQLMPWLMIGMVVGVVVIGWLGTRKR